MSKESSLENSDSQHYITVGSDGIFTLNINDPYAVQALLVYARSIVNNNRALANSICETIYNWCPSSFETKDLAKDYYELMIELTEQKRCENGICKWERIPNGDQSEKCSTCGKVSGK